MNLLAELFFNMEYCENPAITPEIELAKLALVTTQDEEEDEADKAGTDSSNDTDATLVDDMAPRSAYDRAPSSPLQSQSPTGSVLGKRTRDGESGMDLDAPRVASPTERVEAAKRGASPPQTASDTTEVIQDAVASSSKLPVAESPVDVEMKDESQAGKAPPLPPRKPRPTDESVMMFGTCSDA